MIQEFLMYSVMCFLTMYADGSTTCKCRQVATPPTVKQQTLQPKLLRTETVPQSRRQRPM